jgi:hypothetical protein
VHGLRPVDELAVLVAGPTECCEVARGGCLYAWNFTVISQLYVRQCRPNSCGCISDSPLVCGSENSTGQIPCTALCELRSAHTLNGSRPLGETSPLCIYKIT